MSFGGVLDIYGGPQFDETIVKQEVHTYQPQTRSFDYNDTCEIIVNQQDICILPAESSLVIEGRFVAAAAGDGDCTLTHNAALFLFSDISYELNGREVEKVRDPGILTAIRTLLIYSNEELNALKPASWGADLTPLLSADGRFSFRIPLSHLFSVFCDYRKVLSGKHTFRFTRAVNDSNAYINNLAAGTRRATITVTNMELKLKHVVPSDEIRLSMLRHLNANKPVYISFRRWELYELPTLGNTTKDLWSVKTSPATERPRYVIVGLQTARWNSLHHNVTQFDHVSMSSVRLQLNSETYPAEPMRLDFNQNHYGEVYEAYTAFQQSFCGKPTSQPMLDYSEFKDRPLFVFDCTKHPQAVQASTVDVKLVFESSANFPLNTKVYCVIINDCVFEHRSLGGIFQKIH